MEAFGEDLSIGMEGLSMFGHARFVLPSDEKDVLTFDAEKMTFDEGGEEDSNGDDGMASLIPKNGVIFNHAGSAPSPSKDYCQVVVTRDEVTFRWWKISLRQNVSCTPGEIKDSYDDFLYDERIQAELRRVFGRPILEYVKGLAEGHFDYFPRMPKDVIMHIIRYLDLDDVDRLSRVSKFFREMCFSDELWEQIYKDHCETSITEQLISLAEAIGWRKLFYTNKLQIQIQLRRQAQKRDERLGGSEEPAINLEDVSEKDLESPESDGMEKLQEITNKELNTNQNGHTEAEPEEGGSKQNVYLTLME